MSEIRTSEDYRAAVRRRLAGADPALIQDALYDLEEFLRAERAEAGAELTEAALVERALAGFGSPEEVAASYLETDRRVARALATPPPGERLARGIFGVLVDPRAFGGLFLMLFALVTGILYFTWAVTGVALTIGFSILIIGVPFLLLFAASLRALGLLEGRLLETLSGVRMPRRPLPVPAADGLWPRIRYWLTDRRTWTTLVYLIVALPVGIVTFTVATILLVLSLALIALPFAQLFFQQPMITIGTLQYFVPWWTFPLFWLAGLLDLLLALHLGRWFGRGWAGVAKAMLVG